MVIYRLYMCVAAWKTLHMITFLHFSLYIIPIINNFPDFFFYTCCMLVTKFLSLRLLFVAFICTYIHKKYCYMFDQGLSVYNGKLEVLSIMYFHLSNLITQLNVLLVKYPNPFYVMFVKHKRYYSFVACYFYMTQSWYLGIYKMITFAICFAMAHN